MKNKKIIKKVLDKLADANYNTVQLERANFFIDVRLACANKMTKKGGNL